MPNKEWLSREEIRRRILKRLHDGRGRSRRPYPGGTESFCAYRGVRGNRCAVGVLISDRNYVPKIEGLAVFNCSGNIIDDNFLFIQVLVDSKIHPQDFQYLAEWQDRHDNEDNWRGKTYIGPIGHPRM